MIKEIILISSMFSLQGGEISATENYIPYWTNTTVYVPYKANIEDYDDMPTFRILKGYGDVSNCSYQVDKEANFDSPTDVNTNILGTYYVTYYGYSLECGVSSEQTITYIVEDNEGPVIHNALDLTYEYGSKEPNLAAGVYAIDNYDGEIDVSLNDDNVDYNSLGEYYAYYTAIDSNGNITSISKKVNVVDTTAPVIEAPSSFNIEVNDQNFDYKTYIKAMDNYDGDLTYDIYVDDSNVNYKKVSNDNYLYVEVEDSNGNVAYDYINVNIVDSEKPIINGIKDIEISLGEENYNFLEGITATDNYSGYPNLTVDTSLVRYNEVGKYPITYKAIDDNGNETIETVNVNVVDNIKPEIIKSNEEIIIDYGEFNHDFNKYFTVTDNYTNNIILNYDTSRINFEKEGEYPLIVSATDDSGNSETLAFTVKVKPSNAIDIPINEDIPLNDDLSFGEKEEKSKLPILSIISIPSVIGIYIGIKKFILK